MALSMWSDRNGLESPSISLENSRASEEAPLQGAAKQKKEKMLGWEQLAAGSLRPSHGAFCFFAD